jgi:sterol desaturase/sphingolipid hydroxylase (fatty acid hydroxylase superfamily)
MLNITTPYLYIWFALVALNTTFTHSGFKLGWLMVGGHDIHHESYKFNYGTLDIFDRLYGTYKDPSPDTTDITEKSD